MLYIYIQNGTNFQTYQKWDQSNRLQKSKYSRQFYEASVKQERQRLQEEGGFNQYLEKRIHPDQEFGIDLNENSRMDSKIKKIGKTSTKTNETLTELDVNQYLKEIAHYKLPTNKNFKDGAKKLKQLYYYKWEGIEDVLQTIKSLYNQQQTDFKFNISFSYLSVL